MYVINEVRLELEIYLSVNIILIAPTPTMGSRQYPKTEVTRYASIPCSDIRFNRA